MTSYDLCPGCHRPCGVDCHPFCDAGGPVADLTTVSAPPELGGAA